MKSCPNCGCGWGEYKPASSGPCLNAWHDRNDRAIAAQRQRALGSLIELGRKMREDNYPEPLWSPSFSTLKTDDEYMKLKIGYEFLVALDDSNPDDPRLLVTMRAPKETICE